jgi:hypothetical protein
MKLAAASKNKIFALRGRIFTPVHPLLAQAVDEQNTARRNRDILFAAD